MIEEKVRKYGLIIFFAILFFHFLFSDGGLINYIKAKHGIKAAQASISTLDKENALIRSEIDKLQKDDEYLEEVVRKKHGFLREGERLYRIEK
jgi:cell division protein FtsB